MITRRQKATTTITSGTAGVVTLTTPPLYRSTLILVVSQRRSTATVLASPPVQTGATWAKNGATETSATISTERWIVPRVATGPAGSISVTLAGIGEAVVTVLEYQGIAADSPLDVEATNSSNSSSLFSGQTAATTAATKLWLGGIGHVDGGIVQHTPSSGFTEADQTTTGSAATDVRLGVWEKIVPAGGALVDVMVHTDFAVDYAGFIATFIEDTSVVESRDLEADAAIAEGVTIDHFLDLRVVDQVLKTANLEVAIRFDVTSGLNIWIDTVDSVSSLLDVTIQPQLRSDLDVTVLGEGEQQTADLDVFFVNAFETPGFLDMQVLAQQRQDINMDVAVLAIPPLANSITTPENFRYLECRPLWCGVPKTKAIDTQLSVNITT